MLRWILLFMRNAKTFLIDWPAEAFQERMRRQLKVHFWPEAALETSLWGSWWFSRIGFAEHWNLQSSHRCLKILQKPQILTVWFQLSVREDPPKSNSSKKEDELTSNDPIRSLQMFVSAKFFRYVVKYLQIFENVCNVCTFCFKSREFPQQVQLPSPPHDCVNHRCLKSIWGFV